MSRPGLPLDLRYTRHRVVAALHRILGGPATPHGTGGHLSGLMLSERKLIAIAGDDRSPLGIDALLPLARKEGVAVLAGYADEYKRGHGFRFDLVTRRSGEFALMTSLQLWLPEAGWPWLLPEHGGGPAVTLTRRRQIVGSRVPYRDEVSRLLGLARGDAELQHLVWPTPPTPAAARWSGY